MKKAILGCGLCFALSSTAQAQDLAVPAVPDEWFLLETKTVETVRERDSALKTTAMGKDVARVAFLAANGDLECDRISASFEDGGSEWLVLGPGTVLEEGKLYPAELRDGTRESEVIRINYTCSPVAGTEVTLQIYGAR